MLKQEKIDISTTNIANYGSSLHSDQKERKANAEEEWKGAGQKEGLMVWRTKNFGVKREQTFNRTFYAGDCYIVLYSYKKDPTLQALRHKLFFWIGNDSSQDERGTVAYKAVELDDFLRGEPVQYRECQGNESESFLQAIGGSLIIMEGGHASAFHKVKPEEYQPRLLHVKGTSMKTVRVSQVALARSSLNAGDAFILDAGLKLTVWYGKSAGIFEKRKAQELMAEIREQRLGKPSTSVIEDQDDDDAFWTALGGKGDIAPATPDSAQPSPLKTLLRVSNASGSLKWDEVGSSEGKLAKSLLDSGDVFILDSNSNLVVWIGKDANKDEKTHAFTSATEYLAGKGRPTNISIVRVQEGAEPSTFLANFQ